MVISPGTPTPTASTGPTVSTSSATIPASTLDQRVAVVRRALAGVGDERAVGLDDDAEALRAADVDPEQAAGLVGDAFRTRRGP